MTQDLSVKKRNYLVLIVDAATKLKDARDAMKVLAELQNSNATYSGIVQDDIIGNNVHLTPTIINNFLQVVQPAVETAVAAHLSNLMDVLP